MTKANTIDIDMEGLCMTVAAHHIALRFTASHWHAHT